jgi:aminoglycoside phosphotransferase (APT) family kinase protein
LTGETTSGDVDTRALGQWLGAHIDGVDGAVSLRKVGLGQSNPTFSLELADGRRFALRAKPGPAETLLKSAHAIEREYRVMAALAATGFPVPKMIALCEDESVIGRAFFVMEFVEGRVFHDPTLPDLKPAERHALYLDIARKLAWLHSLNPAGLGLEDFGRPAGYVRRNFERWLKQYRASQTEEIEDMEWLIGWLPDHLPKDERVAVIHGDMKIGNLICKPDTPEIAAVVDWEISTLGHPISDLAYFCMIWHMPADMGGLAGLDLDALGIPSEDEVLAAYLLASTEASGADVAIQGWDKQLAFNFFRAAAIVQGIKKRALDGIASNPAALEEGRKIRPFAALGRRIAEEGGVAI